jgi:hypothetical protein
MKNLPKVTDKIEEGLKAVKPKIIYEISEEALEERRLLTAFLLDKKEELIRERNKRKEKIEAETIALRSGQLITRLQIIQFVTSLKHDYFAIFPNTNAFFKNMFRLHPKLYGLDYKKFEKPYLAGKLLKQLTYDRFKTELSTEVLAALIVLAMPDGTRLYKCHQFLTTEGTKHLIRFRNDANDMMENYADLKWYDFKKEYSAKYKLVFQEELFR